MPRRLLPLAMFLLTAVAVSAQESPVVASHWVSHGYESIAAPAAAEFWVTVTWMVPQVAADSKTYYFKRNWQQMDEHADGSLSNLVRGGMSMEGVCGCGPAGRCSHSISVSADDDGPDVDLSLSWQIKKRSGQVHQHFSLAWSELKRTIKDGQAKIDVSVFWPKK